MTSINDLRNQYWGGGQDAEIAALQGFSNAGITAVDTLAIAGERAAIAPTGALYESFPRRVLNNAGLLTSGRESLFGIYLPAGVLITSITFHSLTTAAVTPTAQWFSLRNSSRELLRVTVDGTNGAWGNNAPKTLNLSSTYTTTYTGWYYGGIMVAAGTVPSLVGQLSTGVVSALILPALYGQDATNTGLTTPDTAPATSAVLGSLAGHAWFYVS